MPSRSADGARPERSSSIIYRLPTILHPPVRRTLLPVHSGAASASHGTVGERGTPPLGGSPCQIPAEIVIFWGRGGSSVEKGIFKLPRQACLESSNAAGEFCYSRVTGMTILLVKLKDLAKKINGSIAFNGNSWDPRSSDTEEPPIE